MLAAAHSFVAHVIDAPMAEAYALKEGLLLAQQIGGNRLIIQSDCMEVEGTMKVVSRQTRQHPSMTNATIYGVVSRRFL